MNSEPRKNGNCSLEFLVGFELSHDLYGKGCVTAIDDEHDTCTVEFQNDAPVELDGLTLRLLASPWRIDISAFDERLNAYLREILLLERKIADLRQETCVLQASLRWHQIEQILNVTDELAIAIGSGMDRTLH